MTILSKSKFFASPILNSRIRSANVQNTERWIGFFASPMLIYMAYACMSGSYLNQFYVDVLKLGGVAGGVFLVLLPILSKGFDAVTNLLMGVIIDHTKTRQGKARPWLLISAPLVVLAGIMLYAVPNMSLNGQAIWVAISYNLYFAFAFTIYNMSQSLMVPLSTRNTKQRDGLALLLSMGQSMLPGALVYLVVPIVLLPFMGVDRARWAMVMSIISVIMLPGVLLQYYFTKERVSEDSAAANVRQIGLWTQIKTCFHDKYWLLYFAIIFLYQMQQSLYNASQIFYANWVLGTYNDGITLTLLNAVGQAPLGLGVFLLWPIAKKFGKRRTYFAGMLFACLGSALIFFAPKNLGSVLGALTIKSFGMLPTYLGAAMMAEAMDHIEWKNGYRCDGFTATMSSVLLTVMNGVGTTLFNAGLKTGQPGGYIPPSADGSWVEQSARTQNWFVFCVALIPAVILLIAAVFTYFYDVETQVPQMSKEIADRHRAAAEARGETYYSPEERAAMEQVENDRIAEEKRIEELKAKCASRGMNYEEEEAKYQARLAAKRAREEAKAVKKK